MKTAMGKGAAGKARWGQAPALPDVVHVRERGNGTDKRGSADESLERKRLEEESLRHTECEYGGRRR